MKDQITFRIDKELKQKVLAAAQRDDISVGKWCRKALSLVVARVANRSAKG